MSPVVPTARRRASTKWSAAEIEVLKRYANALAAGRYVEATEAAEECVPELRRLRRADRALPERRRANVARKLREQLLLMGRRPEGRGRRRRPELARVIERHLARLTGPRPPGVRQAARECRLELAEVIKQLGRKDAHLRAKLRLMTQYSMESELKRRSRAEGRRVVPLWTEAETRVVKRHARALLRGKFANLSVAAKACWRELNRKVWRSSGAESSGLRPRTLLATREKLRQEALTVGEGGRGSTR